MKLNTHSLLGALAAAAILISVPAHAQQSGAATSPRPADPTANLPSATGSQTTLPSGAVTGAGQPQGTVKQPNVGAPGGLEERARREARTGASTKATGRTATGATGAAGATGGASGATGTSDGATGTPARAARQSRG